MDYNYVFLCNNWFLFILSWGCWYAILNPSNKSLTLCLPFFHRIMSSYIILGNIFFVFTATCPDKGKDEGKEGKESNEINAPGFLWYCVVIKVIIETMHISLFNQFYRTLIAVDSRNYKSAILCNNWFLFILWLGCWCAIMNLSNKSLILCLPFFIEKCLFI